MLQAYVQTDQRDWVKWLDILQFTYNNAMHSSHNQVPAKLLLGYKPWSPLDFLATSGLEISKGQQPDLSQRVNELSRHRDAARDTIKRSADREAYQFDKGRKAPNLVVGDEVLINPHSLELVNEAGRSHKLMQRKIGLFEIMEVISPMAYRLRLPDTYKGHNVLNIQHLTKYHRSSDKSHLRLNNPRDALPGRIQGRKNRGRKAKKRKAILPDLMERLQCHRRYLAVHPGYTQCPRVVESMAKPFMMPGPIGKACTCT